MEIKRIESVLCEEYKKCMITVEEKNKSFELGYCAHGNGELEYYGSLEDAVGTPRMYLMFYAAHMVESPYFGDLLFKLAKPYAVNAYKNSDGEIIMDCAYIRELKAEGELRKNTIRVFPAYEETGLPCSVKLFDENNCLVEEQLFVDQIVTSEWWRMYERCINAYIKYFIKEKHSPEEVDINEILYQEIVLPTIKMPKFF